MNPMFEEFQEFRKILCVCPSCGGLHRVSDLRLKVRGKAAKTWLDSFDEKELALADKTARFDEKEDELRKWSGMKKV